MAGGYLSKKEVEVLITIERTGAGCSMVAILLTILSYCFVKRLRTTPNLFLLFASIANAGASIASMMGYDGLQKGEDSTLCQSQAFIFEWFMQSDPWWSLAMAVNVFLVFFCNASPSTFRKYAWVYCLVCFGGPLIPAIALISIRDPTKGLIFGDAALWCWIRTDWSLVRLYSYYIPIWFCIFLSIVIYVAVGYQVFHHRNQLRHLAVERRWEKEGTNSSGSRSGSGIRPVSEEVPPIILDGRFVGKSFTNTRPKSLTHRPEFYGTVITEVQVTTDVSKQNCRSEMTIPPNVQLRSPQRARSWALPLDGDVLEGAGEHRGQRVETVCTSNRMPYQQSTVMTRLRAVKSSASMKLKRLDPVKMAYLRTSFIFGFAVLITWIPSSINRLYSLTHDGKISFPFSVASGSVLPLQGVWNAIIYFTTSWSIVKEEFASAKARWLRRDTAPNIRLDSRLGTVGEHRDTFEAHRYPGPARTPSQSGSDAWTRTDSEGQI